MPHGSLAAISSSMKILKFGVEYFGQLLVSFTINLKTWSWSNNIVVVDKVQSLYQGRPVGLEALHCQVPLIFLDQYEEAEHWRPLGFSGSTYTGMPTSSLSTFTSLCKLSLVMNRISNTAYIRQGIETATTKQDLNSLHLELEQWYSMLPMHLKYEASGTFAAVPPPHVLSLL